MGSPFAWPRKARGGLACLAALWIFAAGCAVEPNSNTADKDVRATSGGLCGTTSAWKSSCSKASPDACDDAMVSACSDVTSLLNRSVLEGARGCLRSKKCDTTPSACLAEGISGASKTDAQVQLGRAVCGCLISGEAACIDDIDRNAGPAKAALALALPLSDDIADALREECTHAPNCLGTFDACADSVIERKLEEKLGDDAAKCIGQMVRDSTTEITATDDAKKTSCARKTCEDYDGACGAHDDGCGGSIQCGECVKCTPKKCEDLGQTCGTHDDGCKGTVNCGACPTSCSKDAKEPNDTQATATDLGDATDYPTTNLVQTGLMTSDGDEDWFRIKVSDSGWGGNPIVTAEVKGAPMEVAIFYDCESDPEYSYCNGEGVADETIGKGCRNANTTSLATDCKWWDERGTAYVRVRKLSSDGKCGTYQLNVNVD